MKIKNSNLYLKSLLNKTDILLRIYLIFDIYPEVLEAYYS